MQNAESIYDSFRKHARSLSRRVQQLSNGGYSNEDLHKLRVDIKKMRTILRLVELAGDLAFFRKGYFSSLKPLFKKAGVVRELLVHELLLEQYWMSKQSLQFFENCIRPAIKKADRKLRKAVVQFEPRQLKVMGREIKAVCRNTPLPTMVFTAKAVITNRLNTIRHLVHHNPDEEALHRIRIYIRDITALATLFEEAGRPVLLKRRRQQLMDAGYLMGDWHDLILLTHYITDCIGNIEAPARQAEWKRLESKLLAEKTHLTSGLMTVLEKV